MEIENLNNYKKFHSKEKNLIIDSLRKLVYNHNQLNETSSFESDIEIQKMDFVNARKKKGCTTLDFDGSGYINGKSSTHRL